jgi:hypothetical protein
MILAVGNLRLRNASVSDKFPDTMGYSVETDFLNGCFRG